MVYYGIFELRCSIAKVNKTAAADPQKNGESPLLGNILVSQTVTNLYTGTVPIVVRTVYIYIPYYGGAAHCSRQNLGHAKTWDKNCKIIIIV